MIRPRLAIGQPKPRAIDEHGKRIGPVVGDSKIHSHGTERVFMNSLKQLAEYLAERARAGEIDKRVSFLHRARPQDVRAWLEKRSREVGQTQLNNDRRAVEVTYEIKITPLKSELEQNLKSRAYTSDQVRMVMQCQGQRNALSTEIVHRCGVRAHELYTLRPVAEQPASDRRGWRDDRFGDRAQDGVRYTVDGKGGLIREVCMPRDLAERLEAQRLPEPRRVQDLAINSKDRITYTQHYDIGAGNKWSKSFSDASVRALGWSNGGQGLRHSYAQQRMNEELGAGRTWNEALEIVSQELGHFREDITLVYLR